MYVETKRLKLDKILKDFKFFNIMAQNDDLFRIRFMGYGDDIFGHPVTEGEVRWRYRVELGDDKAKEYLSHSEAAKSIDAAVAKGSQVKIWKDKYRVRREWQTQPGDFTDYEYYEVYTGSSNELSLDEFLAIAQKNKS